MAAATTSPPPRLTTRERLILFILLGAGFMLSADFSILNVALPDVGAGVGLSLGGLPWIASAYALPAAGFTLLFGRLADLFGRRNLFLTGMALLTGASLLGGFAGTAGTLLTARALQGFATAMTTPAAMSLLTSTFTEPKMRARVLGLNGALLSAGFTVGALLGGTLVSLLSWRAAFFINVPVAVAILLLAPSLISGGGVPDRVRTDLPGAVTVTGGLLAVVYAIIEKNVVAAAVGVVLLAVFWLVELRSPAPLAPVRILSRPTVKWGNYAGLVIFFETAMIFMMTLYLQQVLGLSPLATGLIFGLPGLAAVAAGVIAGRLIGSFGHRKVLVAGMTVQGLAVVPLVFLGSSRAGLAIVIPALLIGFFGHVTSIVGYTVTATSDLPNEEQGLATGLTLMTQNVAITAAIPILSSIAATRSSELSGIHLALTVDVALTLVSAALIWFGLRPRDEHRQYRRRRQHHRPYRPATEATASAAPAGRVGPPPPFDPELAQTLAVIVETLPPSITPDLIAALRSGPPGLEALSDDELRRGGAFEVFERTVPGPAGDPDVVVLVCRPAAATAPTPAIYHTHGGGMILGDRRTGLPDIVDLATSVGAAVISVEYRLAPEHPHPAPVEDCYAGLVWVAENAEELNIDPARVVIAGASSGGGLAAAVALLARDRGGPALAAQMLQAPMLDDRNDTASARQMAGIGVWDRTSNETGWAALLGAARGGPDVSPYAAPARATELAGLPPAFLYSGSAETFRDEDVAYASAIWRAGGQAELHVWSGGFHGFDLMAPQATVSQAAKAARASWIRRITAPSA